MGRLDTRTTRATAKAPPRGTRRKRTGTDLIASDVYARLRTKILTLEFKPGLRLVEDELTGTFDAGRTPVREALLRLQGEGLVSRDRGWIVEATDPANFRSIFEARIAIEGYAARLAAERVTPDVLQHLDAVLGDLEVPGKPRSEINRLNRLFHVQIVRSSANPLFIEMHERTQYQYWNLRLPVVFLKEQLDDTTAQHRAILEALKARDGAQAERRAREHIEATMRIVAQALEDA
jgi:DNA-binding GntR family transcriptional regulator